MKGPSLPLRRPGCRSGLVLCLLTAALWVLAVRAGPLTWAAPQAGPPGQTVPTLPPTQPPPPDGGEEQPPPLVETPVPATPISTAAAVSPTATVGAPTSQAISTPTLEVGTSQTTPALTDAPIAPTATRQPGPTAARQTTPQLALAPPALPAPRICAPDTPAAEVTLAPTYGPSSPFSLAWLLLLGVGLALFGLGLFFIFRRGA